MSPARNVASLLTLWFDWPVAITGVQGQGLLTALLRDVSRSFYLTLRILPQSVRRPISLAYLLARATDTIADAASAPVTLRLAALSALRSRIAGTTQGSVDLQSLLINSVDFSPAERALLTRLDEALGFLLELNPFELFHLRRVIETIAAGQELDLQRFELAASPSLCSLSTTEELDDYTYRVAGCVGEFWTHLCRKSVFPSARLDDDQLLADGIRFGKGLQLVNILRDLPKDLAVGRCYLPSDELAAVGLLPTDLLDPNKESQFRPVYNRWLAVANEHLALGWRYTLTLPPANLRLRLACAWPVLIGAQTTARLATTPVLSAAGRVKISRSEVRALIWGSLWRLPFPKVWAGFFNLTRARSQGMMRQVSRTPIAR